MAWMETSPGVFHTDDTHVRCSADDVRFLVQQARINPKRRARLCAHATVDNPVHEMLICLLSDGYVQPHRHNKAESLHVIEGAVDLVLFDDEGKVDEVIAMGADQVQFVRLAPATYHTLCVTTDQFVFHETVRGPFQSADTEYATWAPAETEPQLARSYLRDLQATILQRRTAGHGDS